MILAIENSAHAAMSYYAKHMYVVLRLPIYIHIENVCNVSVIVNDSFIRAGNRNAMRNIYIFRMFFYFL